MQSVSDLSSTKTILRRSGVLKWYWIIDIASSLNLYEGGQAITINERSIWWDEINGLYITDATEFHILFHPKRVLK